MSSMPTHLKSRGRWIRLARVPWVMLALVYFGIFIAAFPFGYAGNQSICDGDDCTAYQLTMAEVRALQELGISHQLYAGYVTGAEVFILTWVALGVFIFLRRSDDWIGLLVSMALISIGIYAFSTNVNLLTNQTPALAPLFNTLSATGTALMILLFFVFPDGGFVPRWTRYVAIPLVVLALADPLLAFVVPPMENAPGTVAGLAVLLTGIVVGTIAQILRFRSHSNLEQRQQTKWVVLGFLALTLVAVTWSITVELYPPSPGPSPGPRASATDGRVLKTAPGPAPPPRWAESLAYPAGPANSPASHRALGQL